jgi:hypothetical protein
MNQPNSNTTRDFIGGLLLVPLLHIAFTIVWFGISALLIMAFPFFNRNYNFFLLFIPIAALSLTQVIYLVPAYIYFIRKQRPEVGKGINLGAIVTLLINGACFGTMGTGGGLPQLVIIGMILAITIGLITYYIVTRRR